MNVQLRRSAERHRGPAMSMSPCVAQRLPLMAPHLAPRNLVAFANVRPDEHSIDRVQDGGGRFPEPSRTGLHPAIADPAVGCGQPMSDQAGMLRPWHALEKDTGAVPHADIELAKQRMADFKRRMDAIRRRPPRAAGKDAPPASRPL
jgi:hypothetical protein